MKTVKVPEIHIRKSLLLELIVTIITLLLSIQTGVSLIIACTGYLLVNVIIRYYIYDNTNQQDRTGGTATLKKIHRICVTGILILLIAAMVILCFGIAAFYYRSHQPSIQQTILLLVLSGVILLLILYHYKVTYKAMDLKGMTFRFLNYANAFILSAFLIIITLLMADTGDADQLTALTTVVLGIGATGITAYILWRAILSEDENKARYLHIRSNSTVIFTRLSLRKDVAVVIGKVILGCISLSGFMLLNALYSAGMGVAKYNAVRVQDKSRMEQIKSHFNIGVGILGASLCYVIYSLRLFVKGSSDQFSLEIALIIAVYTFTELFFLIKDYLKARKSKNLVSEGIKLIGLSSTLICVVLTQTAIMSISYEGDASLYNGLSGVVFGCLAAMIGGYMMLRSVLLRKKENN